MKSRAPRLPVRILACVLLKLVIGNNQRIFAVLLHRADIDHIEPALDVRCGKHSRSCVYPAKLTTLGRFATLHASR